MQFTGGKASEPPAGKKRPAIPNLNEAIKQLEPFYAIGGYVDESKHLGKHTLPELTLSL